MLCSSYEYQEIFVRQAFVFKTAVRVLCFAKKFCLGSYIKFFSFSYCLAKKSSFFRFVQQKNLRVRITLQRVARELQYFRTGGARPRAPKSGTRNKVLRWNWIVFVPKTSVL